MAPIIFVIHQIPQLYHKSLSNYTISFFRIAMSHISFDGTSGNRLPKPLCLVCAVWLCAVCCAGTLSNVKWGLRLGLGLGRCREKAIGSWLMAEWENGCGKGRSTSRLEFLPPN